MKRALAWTALSTVNSLVGQGEHTFKYVGCLWRTTSQQGLRLPIFTRVSILVYTSLIYNMYVCLVVFCNSW